MPDLGGERGRQGGERRGRHADGGEHAQAETIDDPARDRCGDAADQQREAVDQRDRTAARLERALQGGHEDDEGVADRAARHAQREAQRHQHPGHEPAHRLHPCIVGEPSARSAAPGSFDGRHAHHRSAFQRPAAVGQRRLCRRRDGRPLHRSVRRRRRGRDHLARADPDRPPPAGRARRRRAAAARRRHADLRGARRIGGASQAAARADRLGRRAAPRRDRRLAGGHRLHLVRGVRPQARRRRRLARVGHVRTAAGLFALLLPAARQPCRQRGPHPAGVRVGHARLPGRLRRAGHRRHAPRPHRPHDRPGDRAAARRRALRRGRLEDRRGRPQALFRHRPLHREPAGCARSAPAPGSC